MNSQEDIPYITPKTKEFIDDILLHSIYFKIDKMDDNSWRRINSDHPLEWIYSNLHKITLHTLSIIKHTYENMTKKWNAPKHLEFTLELREGSSTYMLAVDLNFIYLDYFIKKYNLIR